MKEERTTPLRERMIEDMRIRGMAEKTQKAHNRGVRDFATFLGRSPDTATPEELRVYQLHITDTALPLIEAGRGAIRPDAEETPVRRDGQHRRDHQGRGRNGPLDAL